MTHLRRSLVASAAFVALFVACGGDTLVTPPKDTVVVIPPPPPPIVVAGVTLTGPSRLLVGRADAVVATARTSAGVAIAGKTFAFASSNPAAVTVGAADGAIRSLAPGTAVISATVDGVVGSLTVTASDASISTLTLTGPTGPIVVGRTAQLTAAGKDSSNTPVAIRALTYASSNPNVVSVTPAGLVTAVAPGTAVISAEAVTVIAANATLTITVIPVPTASVVILPPTDTILRPRFPKQLVAQVRDSAGNVLPRPITYSTSNVDLATLDPLGLVTANPVNQGPVTVTASSDGKSASVSLYVVSDSGFYVATTGGITGDVARISVDQPNVVSPTTVTTVVQPDGVARANIVSSTGSYRARASTSADPRAPAALAGIALLLGATPSAVPVTIGPPSTVVSIPLKPYTATITAPATAAVNAVITVTWTFDETAMPFGFYPDRAPTGTLYFSTTSGADLSGSPVSAVVTRNATTGISTFSASFLAPATPGTIYFQVYADGAVARLLSPIVFSGQAMRTITVQ